MDKKMKNIKIYALGLGALFMLGGCEKNPNESEQYFKQVYLIGAYSDIAKQEVKCNETGKSEVFVSVATSGSLNIDQDVTVTLGLSPKAIDVYNAKYVPYGAIKYQTLPEGMYDIPSKTATVKAGSVYTRVPIMLNTDLMHIDSLYMIPVKIESASNNISIVKKDTVLLVAPVKVNEYSGVYQLSGDRVPIAGGDPARTVSSIRNVVAISHNKVRSYHLWYDELEKNRKWHSYVFTINDDNSVSVTAWQSMNIRSSGGTYYPETKKFSIWYIYETNGNDYKVTVDLEKKEKD